MAHGTDRAKEVNNTIVICLSPMSVQFEIRKINYG